jgi:hypothetical protein
MTFIERPTKPAKLDHQHRHFRLDEDQSEMEQTRQGMALSLRFIESNPSANIKARKEQPGIINFFIGNDPAKWQTNLHSYAEIVYSELWAGIDMVFRNTGGVLKYEFIIRPGANLNNIHLTYDGADNLSLDADGNLLIHTPMGILTEQHPVSYQLDGEQQLPVTTEFALEHQPNGALVFGFTAGADYDPRYPVVIDPGLVYSTYLGGSGFDIGNGIVVDTAGNAYVTGKTFSLDFPTTPGAFQTSLQGIGNAFVTKLNPAGSALVYSTYLGGSDQDGGNGIAVDTSGNAYFTGSTLSTNFPTTLGAFQTSHKGVEDAFVTKLNPAGNALIYSTYLGGSAFDIGRGIAVDTSGNAYVIGLGHSSDFPITPDAFQTTFKGLIDAFVTKLNPAGSALVYSTYLGGSGQDLGNGIVIDTSGNAYITGSTDSTDFPTTLGAFQTSLKAFTDAFVTKLNSAGSALVYSTYLGGNSADNGNGIAIDTSGNSYVTGFTQSTDFPTTPSAFQTSLKGIIDAFVTKLNPAGSALVYSTYLGGSNQDNGLGIAVDTSGNAYVAGLTNSTDFPTTPGALQTTFKGIADAFVTRLNPAGSALVYSTYLGSSEQDDGFGIAADTSGNAYVTGLTFSTDFPTTPGTLQTSLKGVGDAFVTKLQTFPNGPLTFGLKID